MSFKAMLNRTCDIESASFSENAATGEKRYLWAPWKSGVKCRLRNRAANERITGSAEYQTSSHALYLEFLRLDKTAARIVLDEKIYKITGVIDMGGSGEYLCLYLEKWDL
jgi:head-tail adaptor